MTATTTPSPREYVADDRYLTAPAMPTDRPPTKEEVWAYWSHQLDGVKTTDEIKLFARGSWAWAYVYEVNFRGWRKHPDWVPGDPVIHEATPTRAIPLGNYIPRVEELWGLARQIKKERFG